MTFSVWLAVTPFLLLLALSPGPNNFTAMYNGIQVGPKNALIAAIGRNVAFVILMSVSALGLGAVIISSVVWFGIIKWLGVVYLLYIGIKTWRSTMTLEEPDSSGRLVSASHYLRIRQEFLIAISNPKAILIFTAIFPQLLNLNEPVVPQFFIIGTTFIVSEFIAAYVYAMSGKQIRRLIRSPKGMRNLNRSMASVFVMASGLLATATRA